MKVSEFKAGILRQQDGYKSFSPEIINHSWEIDEPRLAMLHSLADRKLGELNAASRWIGDLNFFISMHIAKEATTSSKIEGTQTSIEEAVGNREDLGPEQRDDWQEVQNYISAMNMAVGRLETLPLSNRLLRETHQILLSGVRGKHKSPGEFRHSQNWIGGRLRNADFVPPHHSELPDLMSDLERFLHNDELFVTPLLRIAIAHYQFETIHPFLDGNGRIGRLLIPLYLVSVGILSASTLYLSDYFERNRSDYYDRLTLVRERNDLHQWLKFFFQGVITTCEEAVIRLEMIETLRKRLEAEMVKIGRRAANAQQLLRLLYVRPVVGLHEIHNEIGVSNTTARRLVEDFVNLGILVETTGSMRNRRFAFREYIDIFSNKVEREA